MRSLLGLFAAGALLIATAVSAAETGYVVFARNEHRTGTAQVLAGRCALFIPLNNSDLVSSSLSEVYLRDSLLSSLHGKLWQLRKRQVDGSWRLEFSEGCRPERLWVFIPEVRRSIGVADVATLSDTSIKIASDNSFALSIPKVLQPYMDSLDAPLQYRVILEQLLWRALETDGASEYKESIAYPGLVMHQESGLADPTPLLVAMAVEKNPFESGMAGWARKLLYMSDLHSTESKFVSHLISRVPNATGLFAEIKIPNTNAIFKTTWTSQILQDVRVCSSDFSIQLRIDQAQPKKVPLAPNCRIRRRGAQSVIVVDDKKGVYIADSSALPAQILEPYPPTCQFLDPASTDIIELKAVEPQRLRKKPFDAQLFSSVSCVSESKCKVWFEIGFSASCKITASCPNEKWRTRLEAASPPTRCSAEGNGLRCSVGTIDECVELLEDGDWKVMLGAIDLPLCQSL